MKFISTRRLAAFFKLDLTSTDEELFFDLKTLVNQHFQEHPKMIAFGQEFYKNELDFILNQLKEENRLVFHNWVEKDSLLAEYLFTNGVIIPSDDEIIIPEKDSLLKTYQKFLEPYLLPTLNKKIAECIRLSDLECLSNHLKFSPLLSFDQRIATQEKVITYLNQLLAQIKVGQGKELSEQLKIVYSQNYVEVLNHLDSRFYKHLISYFSTVKLIVKRNDLSPLLLDNIKTSISGLNLKEEDYEQVIAFINSKTFNLRSKKPRSNLEEMVRSPFFLVAVIVLVLNWIYYSPEWDSSLRENAEINRNTIELDEKENIPPSLIDTLKYDVYYKKNDKVLRSKDVYRKIDE